MTFSNFLSGMFFIIKLYLHACDEQALSNRNIDFFVGLTACFTESNIFNHLVSWFIIKSIVQASPAKFVWRQRLPLDCKGPGFESYQDLFFSKKLSA